MKKLLFLCIFVLISCGNTGQNTKLIKREANGETEITSLTLSATNKFTKATTNWEIYYSKAGVHFNVDFIDDDLMINNTYDIGYDDNFEFLINLKTENTSWISKETYHFLMSGNGNIYFERAIGPNKIGDRFSKEMGIVLGENLDYNCEIVEDYGFQASVFLAYDLLNTNYEEAYNNLTFCPAMRNAHIYGADSVWEYSKKDGCSWANPSTFIKI